MTQLQTEWLCIATSGTTIDGRTLSQQQLQEMAETYKPATYTALLWLEHSRREDNLGQVLELKAEQQGEQTKLYARLRPTTRLVELNQQKQKLFTSIEIIPNFVGTGKAYLGGLGVTDSPASLGTTQLQFSIRGNTQQSVILGDREPLKFSLNTDNKTIRKLFDAFNCLSYADKIELFRQLGIQYTFSAGNPPSIASYLGAKKAITYLRFNLAV